MSYIVRNGKANIAMAKLFYFCDSDGLYFDFKLDNKNLHSYIEESLDPIFKGLHDNNTQIYSEQKKLFLEYLQYRVVTPEENYMENTKEFQAALYYFQNIYFSRIENIL